MPLNEIALTQGKVAIVDAADYAWLSRWKWRAQKRSRTWYAERKEKNGDGKRRTIRMHREILGLSPGDGLECDHVNRYGLDNRRSNLRIATHVQNMRNGRKRLDNKSGYIGVDWHKATGRWRAQIRANGKTLHLGLFDDKHVAARVRDEAALKHHKKFARLNFN